MFDFSTAKIKSIQYISIYIDNCVPSILIRELFKMQFLFISPNITTINISGYAVISYCPWKFSNLINFSKFVVYSTDLGSDLLDELEQAKHFPTRDVACRSVRQQLEKLSVLTKQHAILLEDYEKKLNDCIELQQLEQQANQVSIYVAIHVVRLGYLKITDL